MVHSRRFWLCSLLLPFVLAQDSTPFDCHVTLDGSHKYDLTPLAGEHTLQRTRDMPPTTMIDEVRFDLCADLKPKDGVAEGDQCPPGTRACLTKTNKKGDDSRIVSVIPLARTELLKPDISPLTFTKGLSIVFHGPSYPSTASIPQSFNLTLLCESTISNVDFTSYENGQLRLEWKGPAGCEATNEPPPNDDKKGDDKGEGDKGGKGGQPKNVGSGVGWFFLLLLLAFLAYLALGAYYNYSTYGASGLDLIPHRDFWRDVPYLLRDVVSHLCGSVRPRHNSNRGGYIAV